MNHPDNSHVQVHSATRTVFVIAQHNHVSVCDRQYLYYTILNIKMWSWTWLWLLKYQGRGYMWHMHKCVSCVTGELHAASVVLLSTGSMNPNPTTFFQSLISSVPSIKSLFQRPAWIPIPMTSFGAWQTESWCRVTNIISGISKKSGSESFQIRI